ncbi:MAG TPA: hypothetical protein VEU77_02215 [Candidatus Acidoferrales bacterium]|nr:hypothetical protein [Candidatus Acidoferrales bacterium]
MLAHSRSDARITGGAITGSAAIGGEDRWSDIDLAFGVRGPSDMLPVLDGFTRVMYDDEGCVDHLDVPSRAWIYRVFLLRSTLQVDVAVAPAPDFGARQPTFRLVFGESTELPHVPLPDPRELIGYAWLYALHVRSSIKRGRYWQAEYMVSAMRDHVLSLACLRLGLPAREGRGLHQLPMDVTGPLEEALVGRVDAEPLTRALRVTTDALLREAQLANVEQARRIDAVVRELAAG